MKRYLLFAFDRYYPQGAELDFIGDFASVEDAGDYFRSMGPGPRNDFAELLDTATGTWLNLNPATGVVLP